MTDTPSKPPAAPPKAIPENARYHEAPRLVTRVLSHRKPTRFDWRPDGPRRAALAQALDLPRVNAFRFKGEILPEGGADFRLEGQFEAEIEQACVVTLVPVPASLSETVMRRYLTGWSEPDGDEVEIPEEDAEAMPEVIDIAEVAREALSLALPLYPRAESAGLETLSFGSEAPQDDEEEKRKPFAGLAQLLTKAQKTGDQQ